MSGAGMLTAQCLGCQTTLSYPAHSMYIQCPKCQSTFNPQQVGVTPPQPAPPPLSQQQIIDSSNGGLSQSTKYIHCYNCRTLLSHPPTSVTIQCPKCLAIMDIPQSASLSVGGADNGKAGSLGAGSRKKRKDPMAPKRASNAYMIFCKEKRAELKQNRPDLPFGQLGKRLGEMWRSMTPDERQPYETRATNDRDRYKGQMNEYQSMTMMKSAAGAGVSSGTSVGENGENEALSQQQTPHSHDDDGHHDDDDEDNDGDGDGDGDGDHEADSGVKRLKADDIGTVSGSDGGAATDSFQHHHNIVQTLVKTDPQETFSQ